jgi:predicted metal-dependent phosphoesterase TrpH
MKVLSSFLIGFCLTVNLQLRAQVQNEDVYEYPALKQMKMLNYRSNINIPDIEGYKTLKCDFHLHTVFSDGHVWPTMRVVEAWTEGLDAIAITDHIENRKNKDILQIDLNKSGEMAVEKGKEIGLIVIRGAEITRRKPLGHVNALFLQDVKKLDVPDEIEAINQAVSQGAYLFLNHPGWPNDTSTLYPIHRELIVQKKIRGVEVFNGSELYPKVLDWCNEYGLTWFANSDLHYASVNSYREKLQHPMTLVFAKEYSAEAIKDALFDGRTLACFNSHLAGKEVYIKEIIQKSLFVKVINRGKNLIEICNKSDIPYEIRFGEYMYSIPLFANQTLRINLPSGTEVTFTNCLTGQGKFVKMKLW